MLFNVPKVHVFSQNLLEATSGMEDCDWFPETMLPFPLLVILSCLRLVLAESQFVFCYGEGGVISSVSCAIE